MIYWAKCLKHKHEGKGSDPKHPCKCLVDVMVFRSQTMGAETAGLWSKLAR